jgi:ParB-like chromosome segregation protein Spo0J
MRLHLSLIPLDVELLIPVYWRHPRCGNKTSKKDLTVREHLMAIQSDGGKARWAKLTPEERSAQARKIVAARWSKKRTAQVVPATTSSTKPSNGRQKHPPRTNSAAFHLRIFSRGIRFEIELPGGDSLRAALLQVCRSFLKRLDISPWTH